MKTAAMKKTLVYFIFVLLVTSCTLSRTEWVSFENYSGLDPEISFIPYSWENTVLDSEGILSGHLVGGESVEDILESEALTKTTHTSGAGLVRSIISCWGSSSIRSYCGTYYSTDEDGKKILLSGRIILPSDGKVSRIMLVSHFTIGADSEAPSREVPLEAIYAAKGIAVVEPDYIGYGASRDRIHPYLCASLTAKNVIDMYYAALPFLKKIGCSPRYDDIFLLGYSQGGATTMSVAHELEWFHPDVDIRLAMCGGGPYDICATYDTLVDNDFTDYPCAIPMIIQGMNVGEHLELDYGSFFLPKMVDNMDEWLNSKLYTMREITFMMGSNRLSSIMTEKARNKSEDLMTYMYKAMLDNSVVSFPVPDCPIYLFHSFDDNVVPYVNAVSLTRFTQESNVIYNFGHYGNHVSGCLRFLFCCLDLMEAHNDI